MPLDPLLVTALTARPPPPPPPTPIPLSTPLPAPSKPSPTPRPRTIKIFHLVRCKGKIPRLSRAKLPVLCLSRLRLFTIGYKIYARTANNSHLIHFSVKTSTLLRRARYSRAPRKFNVSWKLNACKNMLEILVVRVLCMNGVTKGARLELVCYSRLNNVIVKFHCKFGEIARFVYFRMCFSA